MRSRRIAAKGLLLCAISLSLAALPAIPDTSTAASAEHKKLCYCGCDMADGAPMCHHMCELPQYERRSWATSCHAPPQADIDQSSPAQPRSRRTNRVEDAKLN